MKGEGLSQSALGRALGLSPPAITKLKGQGMPVHSMEAAQAWRMERQSVARRKRSPAPPPAAQQSADVLPLGVDDAEQDVPDFNISRARREAADARLAELSLAKERGDLVRVSDIRASLARRAATYREAMLQIPGRLAAQLAAETDQARTYALIDAEIRAAMAHLTETTA